GLAIRIQSVVTLILVGVALSSFAGAVMALMLNLAPNPFTLADMVNWTLGSVANRSVADMARILPFLVAGFAILWLSRRGLSALTLGEEAAAGLGLDLKRQRIFVVVGAGLATGAAVSLAGAIGFVGIVAPHLVRPWVDSDPARTLLPSALLGGIMLVLADIGVRLIPTGSELKLGVVAALVGAPVFAWIAAQARPGRG
ncbi:MAG: iron ABC transporter permease, partial [Pseudomonadota bacterium]